MILLFSFLISCKQPVSVKTTRINVLTTIAPISCFTKNIAAHVADVDTLLPAGADPHAYSLSPDDAKKIAQADIIIMNGVHLESWLERLISSPEHATGGRVLDTSSGIEVIDNDPHIWLSPRNAIIQVRHIRDGLITADPGNKTVYEENAAAYITRLERLDKELSDEISGWKRKDFVAFHPAFRYIAKDYGLDLAAVIHASPEIEPSPKQIAHVIDTIKSRGITSVFTDTGTTHRIVGSIAADLELNIYYLDTMEAGEADKAYYENKTRANISALKKALQ